MNLVSNFKNQNPLPNLKYLIYKFFESTIINNIYIIWI
jgi:hypothetical protein